MSLGQFLCFALCFDKDMYGLISCLTSKIKVKLFKMQGLS